MILNSSQRPLDIDLKGGKGGGGGEEEGKEGGRQQQQVDNIVSVSAETDPECIFLYAKDYLESDTHVAFWIECHMCCKCRQVL